MDNIFSFLWPFLWCQMCCINMLNWRKWTTKKAAIINSDDDHKTNIENLLSEYAVAQLLSVLLPLLKLQYARRIIFNSKLCIQCFFFLIFVAIIIQVVCFLYYKPSKWNVSHTMDKHPHIIFMQFSCVAYIVCRIRYEKVKFYQEKWWQILHSKRNDCFFFLLVAMFHFFFRWKIKSDFNFFLLFVCFCA